MSTSTKPYVTDEQPMSKHELNLYGFSQQPLVGNERIGAMAATYTKGDHGTLIGHRSQSFKAGSWETRSIYEAHLADLRRERDNIRAFVENMIKCECWGRVEYLDGGSVQDEAERMGILVQVPHELPCSKEFCGCEGEDADYLYNFHWRISTLNTHTSDAK